jgi:hypothetical protein
MQIRMALHHFHRLNCAGRVQLNMSYTCVMPEDDIEKLLREINATPAASSSASNEITPSTKKSPGGRLAFGLVAAATIGFTGAFMGLLMPFIGMWSTGIGAAAGAFITGIIAGPPRWFSS